MKFFTHLAVGDHEVGPEDMTNDNTVSITIGVGTHTIVSELSDNVTISTISARGDSERPGITWSRNTSDSGFNGTVTVSSTAVERHDGLIITVRTSEGNFFLILNAG